MADRKVLAVFGSPRLKGNSTILAKNIIVGAESNGAVVESFYLSEMNIHPCTGCNNCQDDLTIDCVIKDDMAPIYPKIREAYALIIASPIYWFSVSAQTKTFIDRLYTLLSPEGNDLKGKRIAIALTYGDKDPFISGAVNAIRMFQDMFHYVGANIIGMVYGSALNPGDIESDETLIDRAYKLGMKLVPKK
jgi:multimeric flavodoxin WrbA